MKNKTYSLTRDFWKNAKYCFSSALQSARSIFYNNDEE